jgi:hypothetical protein
MRRKLFWILVTCLILGVFAWSPWIDEETAVTLTETQFNKAWSRVIDGCGTSWEEYGARDFRKVPFGAMVTLYYQCGLVMEGEPALQRDVFVAFFGIAFGYPAP